MIEATKILKSKYTVLLADDEPEIVKFFRSVFSKEGYRVINVQNGNRVLHKVKKGGIDLVIMDVVMPNMDGMKALKELKRMAPRLPVIVLSGYGDLQTARQAMLIGAQDFITKPFDVDFMKAVVKQAIRKAALRTHAISK
ncbi:MAG TPA: response regulator [Candidatus Hypogeohydataceae bacterium YC41]